MNSTQTLSRESASQLLNDSYDDLCKSCRPLFNNTPINYFDYVRYYDNGEAIAFSTSPEFSTYTLSESLLPTFEEFKITSLFGQKASFLSTATSLPPGVCLLNQEKYEKNLSYATDNKIYHRLYITERHKGYYITCGFGVVKDIKSILNFYMNALPHLEKFLRYFEFHASDFIHYHSQKNKFIMPGYHEILIQKSYDFGFPLLNPSDLNFSTYIKSSDQDIYNLITPKEKKCLELIAHGYTMKNAARMLGISPRTVEQHLRNVKDKLGVNTKNQLVELWHIYFNYNKAIGD